MSENDTKDWFDSASTCSSKLDINTQISTVRNQSLNCQWILQIGVHNLLHCTDSNRPRVCENAVVIIMRGSQRQGNLNEAFY